MKLLKLFFIVLMSNFMFSCVSTSVMKLKPIGQESIFDGGKEIVKQEKEGIKVVASYDGRYQKYMVFDVEVFNNTSAPLTVSPKDFTFTPLDANKQLLYSVDGQLAYNYVGVEPQEQMNLIRQEMNFQDAKIKRARVVNTVLIVGGIAALIATSGRYSENTWKTARAAETVVQVAQMKRIIDHGNYYSRMEKLDHEERMWAQENFRTTTLAPGTSIRGGVFLEANPRAKFVQINYEGASNRIAFLFEQWFQNK